ncbi:MAG: MGMT family protein [Pseudomonadota bacterium]
MTTPIDTRQERLQRLWQTISAIPKGRVCSYGEVAQLAGIPNGARQTAWALRQLPSDTGIPWHRVINAQGKVAMPEGSQGWTEQRRRLRAEGVTFSRTGRIADPAFWWRA